MKAIVKSYIVRDRHFTIVHDQDHYLAIEDKYIDKNGRLTQALNGFQMYASQTLEGCMKHVTDCVENDYLIAQGFSKAEAFCIVNGIELTDQVKALFANIPD